MNNKTINYFINSLNEIDDNLSQCENTIKGIEGELITKSRIQLNKIIKQFEKNKTIVIAGTGHRPNKLGGYSNDIFNNLIKLGEDSLKELKPTKVITGMALGWDMALAQASYNLNIPYVCAIQFKGQEIKWPKESQNLYHNLLAKSNKIVYVCDGDYAPYKMQKRNEWMVDNCDILLALWDGTNGGTYNCIKYAENKRIINLYNKL